MSKDSSVKTMNTILFIDDGSKDTTIDHLQNLLLTIAMLSFYHLVEISEKAAMIAWLSK